MDANYVMDFILASMRAATPLIFGALGVVTAERAGVRLLANEGVMLLAALTSVMGTVYTGSLLLGILISLIIGAITGLLLAAMKVWIPTNQTIVGIGINISMVGLTSYIFRLGGDKLRVTVPKVPNVFGFSIFDILAIVLVIAVWIFLFKTGPGLKLRSLGESAVASDAAGINVLKVRTITLMVACIFSSLGGIALSIGWVRVFTDNMVMGRGFIAMAAVYFGKWNPLLTTISAIMFGAAEALAFRAQAFSTSISSFYFFMIPYVLTLVAVALSGRMKGPADVGKPYIRR
ncbi:MAG: ABC transporter permease [Christensenellales bacterium]|jgi:ABC-type uncharacterized transport system permease subunit